MVTLLIFFYVYNSYLVLRRDWETWRQSRMCK